MKNTMKRLLAMILALTLVCGQLVLPAMAEDVPGDVPAENLTPATPTAPAPTPVTVEVEVPSAPGGGNEQVEVDVTVTANSDGTFTAKAETAAGGDTTPSGNTVEYTSEVTETPDGTVISEDTDYSVVSADGNYTAKGGTDTTTVADAGTDPNLATEVDLVDENGNLQSSVTVGGEVTSETKATNPDDKTKAEDSANFDQTTTTTTEREVAVDVTGVTVETSDPAITGIDGITTPANGGDGFTWSDCISVAGYGSSAYWNVLDAEGNVVRTRNPGNVNQWEVTNENSGESMDGLYCVDASTTAVPYFEYRMVNLEDAVEQGYYTEEDAAKLRTIVTNGYDFDAENLNDFKAKLVEEGVLSEDCGLTEKEAAQATNYAIWYYGNRYGLKDGQTMEFQCSNENVLGIYNYLLNLEAKDAPEDEKQIINEEKFIDDMELVVGTMVQGDAANQDDNDTNDVYNVGLKFSLVVTPDENDNLVVKVLDSNGDTVQSAMIPTSDEHTADKGYAKSEVDANGKTYYVLEGMQLTENANTQFNLKLEGTQMLTEGVYVFESQHMNDDDSGKKFVEFCEEIHKTGVVPYGYGGVMNTYKEIRNYYTDTATGEVDMEKVIDAFKGAITDSQNFIGKFSGEATVDVGMTVDLTFNVEEKTVTTTREWRIEADPAPTGGGDGGGTPRTGGRTLPGTNVQDRVAPDDAAVQLWAEDLQEAADGTAIPDEAVPLAAAKKTGDISGIFAAMSLLCLGGAYLAIRKERMI